jgi:Ser/Thr protein kinase RdoA (MazF antagonist)
MKGTEFSKTAARIAQRFALASGPLLIEPLGRGLINESFKVTAGTDRWVLQRINGQVFADPEGIMANLSRLAAHLARQEGLDLTWPALAQTAEGATWTRDEEGAVWRLMTFIPGQPLERIEGAAQAAEVGRLLGAFHRAVADLDPASLRVTLPGFHVTPGYLEPFDRVAREAVTAPQVRSSTRRWPSWRRGGWAWGCWSRRGRRVCSRSGSSTAIPSWTTCCSMPRDGGPWP